MPMGVRTLPLHVRWAKPGTIHLWAFDLLAVNEKRPGRSVATG